MSIEKIGGLYCLMCDVCGSEVDKNFDDFYEAVNYKKTNDWKSKKYGTDWVDVCPCCQE